MEHNQTTLRTVWYLYVSCCIVLHELWTLFPSVCNVWKWQVPKPERHLNTQTYVIFIGCLCSMWLRSGTSEIWHWRWNLLCSYQDRRRRSDKHTQKKKTKNTRVQTRNSAELIACSCLLCVLGAGAGGARAHWSPAETRVYRRSANLSGGGMWLWCYFPQSAEGPASGEFLIFWGVLIRHQFPNPYRLFLFLQEANQTWCQTSLCSLCSFFHLNESINTFLIREKNQQVNWKWLE